ncbi:MAG: adenosine deaminase [Parcubacteria group bacterium CG23_combo_of_CG06-09_8_20_14_all_35_9]|nr:MAG: adenosine deaminase [Parcubacteria group bacterium CG23_combo_of_CG06-09_8_20_14_all_35_9]
MGTKKSLLKANKIKDDEFYTLYEDVANEVSLYKNQLKGKRILCPCDWDESYNEEIVYKEEGFVGPSNLFATGGTIKRIDIKASKKKIEKDLALIKCNFIKFLVAHAEDYKIKTISVSGYNPSNGEGVRFQDVDYSKYDLVITNPPFSQFREFIDTIFKNKMKFLVIGPLTAITYRDIFNHIKDNEMWLGYAKQLSGFRLLDDTLVLSKNPEGSVPRACKWYTNLDVAYRHDRMILTENYSREKYPKYDNYEGIEVSQTKKIPHDYTGVMGVPVTFLTKFNPDQFEIVKFRKGDDEKDLSVKGKYPFARILIKNRELIKNEK